MPPKTICKSVFQYSKESISGTDMQKLLAIAKDYQTIKGHVYQRYGSISALPKLYPGYTIQREMAASPLRTQLGLPAVYFNLAIFDALGDIRNNWIKTKQSVRARINQNKNFSETEKHYLRFALKADKAFSGILNQEAPEQWQFTDAIRKQYETLAESLPSEPLTNTEARKKLHRYLRRQVRKLHKKPIVTATNGFYSSKETHRYADHGIYFTTKEPRKRVFVPLTDANTYHGQLYVMLYPEECRIKLQATIQAAVQKHPEYNNDVEVTLGDSIILI